MARQQARLGTCRLGAVRLGDFYPNVTLHINSLQAYRPGGAQGVMVDPSLTIQEADGDVPMRASFKIREATSPPQQGQAVYIDLGQGNRIFGGQIISCTQDQTRYVDRPVFTVTAESNHRLMNRRRISARFTSKDAGEIIRTLVTSWTSGFISTRVSSMGTVDEIEFTRELPTKAISRVVNRVGGRWYLDGRNNVHAFVGEEDGASQPPDILSGGKHQNWTHERDISQVRTKIAVKGGGHGTSQLHLAGTTTVFLDDTHYLTGVTTITAGGRFYDVASVNRTAAPWFIVLSNSLSVGGLEDSLPAGTPVNVWAVAQSTTLQNSIAAIEGGDGIHEYDLADGRLTQDGALSRARAELTLFGSIEHRGGYDRRDPSDQAGRMVVINVDSPTHVTGVSARIQRVTVSKFEQSSRSWNENRTHKFPWRKVTYSTAAVRDVAEILGDFERGE